MRLRRRDVRTHDGAHPPPESPRSALPCGAWMRRDSGVSFCKLRCVRPAILNAQLFHLLGEFGTEDAVAVAQQIARRAVPRKSLPQLLRGPFRGWMSGDAKMQNAPPLMRQHQEHVEHREPDGRYRKEVDRNHGLEVVLKEGSPDFGGRVVAAHQVLAHTRLANVDAELEQWICCKC